MKGTEKVRLAADGWRIGSPAEFLGLSNEEAALVVKGDHARVRLAAHHHEQ